MKKKANRKRSSTFFLVRTYDILDIIRPIVVAVNVLFCFVCLFFFFRLFSMPSPFSNLVPRALSLASRENPGYGWSRGSHNLGTKNKGGEEE